MKKKYIIPQTYIIPIETRHALLTMSISDIETSTQFAPFMDDELLNDDINIVLGINMP